MLSSNNIYNANVGIGTASPGEKLTVVDPANLNQYNGTLGIYANNLTEGIGIGYMGIQAVGSNASQDLSFNAKGTGNITMQVSRTTGNVGIATGNPLTPLDVNGVINSATGYEIANGAAAGNYLRGNGTNFVSSAIQAADLPSGNGNYIQNRTSIQPTSNFNISGIGYAQGSLQAPVFYDLSNTAYYVQPSSTSILNNVRFNSADCLNGNCPTNGAIRYTPNFYLNAVNGSAVLINWDNGTTAGANTKQLRVGTGQAADAFYVTSAGNTFASYFNSTDNTVSSGVTGVMVKQGDNYIRTANASALASFVVPGASSNVSKVGYSAGPTVYQYIPYNASAQTPISGSTNTVAMAASGNILLVANVTITAGDGTNDIIYSGPEDFGNGNTALAGDASYRIEVQRSPNNSSWTTVMTSSAHCGMQVPDANNFYATTGSGSQNDAGVFGDRYSFPGNVSINYIDPVTTGTWYYRLVMTPLNINAIGGYYCVFDWSLNAVPLAR